MTELTPEPNAAAASAQPSNPATEAGADTSISANTAALADIQGNIIGFKNDHQRLLFIGFADTPSAKAFTAVIASEVNSGLEVLHANYRHSERQRLDTDQLTELDSWVNVAFSFTGLQILGATGLDTFPEDYRSDMVGRAATIGDVDDSAPAGWLPPFAPSAPPVHALVTIAADSIDLLEARTAAVRSVLGAHAVTELSSQDGNVRPAPNIGHEHFGFKDGVSQPGIAGFTEASKGGSPIAAGEFLIGYPDQDGHVSGSASPAGPPPQSGQAGYPGPGAPAGPAMPDWTRNGSFAVYRRLRQDVAGFRAFLAQNAAAIGLSPDQLGAKLVGRWPSGAPLEPTANIAATGDPSTQDPSTSDPTVLENDRINDFDFSSDPDGIATPLAAHIRKAWPRDSAPGGATETNRHRMLRRGIPYGPDFVAGEPAYGQAVPDTQDRGLLFVCFQSSIARSFEFVQASWANTPDFPKPASGQDPIISQNSASPGLAIPPNPHVATARWVITTGGGYFFAPSLSALHTLSS